MTTGELLQKYREDAGLTRKELADASGVPIRTLEKLEQGVISEPKLVTVGKLAACLNRTCADFLPPTAPPPARADSPGPPPEPKKVARSRKR